MLDIRGRFSAVRWQRAEGFTVWARDRLGFPPGLSFVKPHSSCKSGIQHARSRSDTCDAALNSPQQSSDRLPCSPKRVFHKIPQGIWPFRRFLRPIREWQDLYNFYGIDVFSHKCRSEKVIIGQVMGHILKAQLFQSAGKSIV